MANLAEPGAEPGAGGKPGNPGVVIGDPIEDVTEPPPGLPERLPLPVSQPGGTEIDLGACCCKVPLDGVLIMDDGKARGLENLPPATKNKNIGLLTYYLLCKFIFTAHSLS